MIAKGGSTHLEFALIKRIAIASFENTEDTTAVYKNELYDISFDCSDYGRINLSGLDDATTLGSSFGNSEILHIN